MCASFGSTRLMCASFGSTRLMCASFGSTRLICASFGSTRLMCASFGSTRLICVSFGSTRLICAFYGTTRLLCRVRAQRGADRREAGRTREGHMDASGFLIASAIYGIHLSKEQCPKTPQEVEGMSNIPYASAVGSLMYAMLCTRPDICYSVGIVSRYQSNPGRDHWTVIFKLIKDARKSTSGSVFTLNGGAVVWRSIKQSCIVDSTMEAEYVAACEAAKEAVWLKKFLTDLEVVPNMYLSITYTVTIVVQLQIHENLKVINEESTLNERTISSGKSYIEETLL
ncbi:gag/pol protein [Cucumis melo var. makuwa]|uniref:Gag/pol protein n=1 Tax=Cucumis melo var. makuwa TaxID=1194695 RepID=A0A5D3DH24_CUCMM|nr:gag/pol protein [Cucumis melo var. makuwa]